MRHFHADFAAGGLVAFRFVDQWMLAQFPFQRLGRDALHLFPDRVDTFMLEDAFHFFFGDEAGISGILDDQFYVTAGLVGRLAVESGDGYAEVGDKHQHDDR